jgi:DNA mismatch endonuclease, patch repair protein
LAVGKAPLEPSFENNATACRQNRRRTSVANQAKPLAAEAAAAARRIRAHSEGRHPAPVTEGRSRNMQAIRRTNTKPEVTLRSALHRLGYRFRKDLRIAAGERWVRPDIVFTRARVAVFVDGCFWHACPEHGRQPGVNQWYWSPKLAQNVSRDRLNDSALEHNGWRVVRIWEHVPIEAAVDLVRGAID